jgi:recombination protein RecA
MAEERTEKNKAIDLAFSQIEKQFGKGSIMRLGSIDPSLALDAISSGSFHWTLHLESGYPRPVIEIFGPESSGKTTYRFMPSRKRKNGGTAASSTPTRADACTRESCDIDNLLVPARQRRTGAGEPKS